jgi:two-component sensor histidine kinase
MKLWHSQTVVLLLASLLFTLASKADTLQIRSSAVLQQPLPLAAYWQALEDSAGEYHLAAIEAHPQWFRPFQQWQPKHARSTYWLKMVLTTRAGQPVSPLVLSFRNLTFVDLFVYGANAALLHQKAGAFRPKKDILTDDDRFYFSLQPKAGESYTLLLKVQHTKGYLPELLFNLQQKDAFLHDLHQKQVTDSLVFGALLIFFLYTLLSWLVSQFRPYAWLLLTISGVGLYSLSMNGYFIDLFFPEYPEAGWLFNLHFIHIGFLGVFLLMIDFWQFRTEYPHLYRLGMILLAIKVCVSVVSLGNNYFRSDYHLTNLINVWSFLLPFSYFTYCIWYCWRKLNHAQRFLAYGIILFELAGMAVSLTSALLHEQSIAITPHIANFTTFGVVLLFSTGLKEELRQSEIKRNASLQRLALLQKFQNETLEKKVEERTEQLRTRNARIETLINELHHRVKNNLQLLYSLNQLQLPGVTDSKAQDILRSNVAKIKAMILVNQKLYQFDDVTSVNLKEFIEELTAYSERIYDSKGAIRIALSLPDDIQMDAAHILSFGLIVAELLTNAYKYAFADVKEPLIRISILPVNQDTFQFIFSDNGPGLPPGRENVSMGLPLIKDLSRQLNATIEIRNDNGLMYIFTIPV